MKKINVGIELEVDDDADEEVVRKELERTLTVTVCAYCGHESPKGDKQAIVDHILTCDKRPEKKLLEKAFEVEDGLFDKITHLTEHPYDPETCDTCQVIRETLEAYNDTGKG